MHKHCSGQTGCVTVATSLRKTSPRLSLLSPFLPLGVWLSQEVTVQLPGEDCLPPGKGPFSVPGRALPQGWARLGEAFLLARRCLIQPVSGNPVKWRVYVQVKASPLELEGFPPEPQVDVVQCIPLAEGNSYFAVCWSFCLLCYEAGWAAMSGTSLQACL